MQNHDFLVFIQEVLQAIETEVETPRVLLAKQEELMEQLHERLANINKLEVDRMDALDQTLGVQAQQEVIYDKRLPVEKGIKEGGLVLLYNSRYKKIPSKLHTRWIGLFRVVIQCAIGLIRKVWN